MRKLGFRGGTRRSGALLEFRCLAFSEFNHMYLYKTRPEERALEVVLIVFPLARQYGGFEFTIGRGGGAEWCHSSWTLFPGLFSWTLSSQTISSWFFLFGLLDSFCADSFFLNCFFSNCFFLNFSSSTHSPRLLLSGIFLFFFLDCFILDTLSLESFFIGILMDCFLFGCFFLD